MRFSLFIGIFFTSLTVSALAQISPFTKYTVQDGLPSSTIYSITQDHNGFIWMGTDNGLCMFDGYEFKRFNKSKSENPTTSIITKYDQIIQGQYKAGLSIRNQRGTILKNLKQFSLANTYDDIAFHKDYTVILNKGFNLSLVDLYNNELVFIDHLISTDSSNFPLCIYATDSIVLCGRTKGIYMLNHTDNEYSLNSLITEYKNVSSITKLDSVYLIFASGNAIYKLNTISWEVLPVYTFTELDYTLKQITVVNDSTIIALTDHPSMLYRIGLSKKGPHLSNILKGSYNINCFLIDNSNNIWIGTNANGLIKLCYDNISFYEIGEDYKVHINEITLTNNGSVLLGTTNGIYTYDQNSNLFHQIKIHNQKPEYISDINVYQNLILASTLDPSLTGGLRTILDTVINGNRIFYCPSSSSSFLSDSIIVAGNWQSGLEFYKLNSKPKFHTSIKVSKESRNKINDISNFQDIIWVAADDGLYCVENKLFTKKINGERVKKITSLNDTLFYCLGENGLLFFNKNQISKISRWLPVPLIKINAISLDNFNNIWIASSIGIIKVNSKLQSALIYNENSGLPTSNFSDIIFSDHSGSILATSGPYLIMFSTTEIEKDNQIPPINITGIYSNNQFFTANHNVKVGPTNQVIKINYVSLNYENPSAVKYRYKVDNEQWTYTDKREIEFHDLSKGQHSIYIASSLYGGTWSDPSAVELYVIPPIWNTNYFYLISSFIIFSLSYRAFKKRYVSLKYVSKQKVFAQAKFDEISSRLNASNLNPHFIFNVLNSIKSFIKSNNADASGIYLDRFSKLIRMNLNSSNDSFVRIVDDVNKLKHYLELESLRMANGLEYRVIISPEISIYDTWIPNMIIQPLVENSIWHGFPEKHDFIKPRVEIKFSIENEDLCIVVKDNGIGILHDPFESGNSLTNRGLNFVLSRIKSIDPFAQAPISVTKASKNDKNPGSEVTIRLTPKSYHIRPRPFPQ